MDSRKNLRSILLYVGIPIIVVIEYFEKDQVSEFELDLGTGACAIKLRSDANKVITYQVPNVSLFLEDVRSYVQSYNEAHPDDKIVYNYLPRKETSVLVQLLPYLLMVVAMALSKSL